MKKRMLIFLIAAVGFIGGGAHAQTAYAGGGLTLNILAGTLLFGFDLQVGSDNLFARNFGGRFAFDLFVTPAFALALGLDLYGRFPTGNIAPYVGVGASIVPTVNPLLFTIHGLAGVDIRLSKPVSLFFEITPGIALQGGATGFDIGINFGIRGHF